MLFNRRERQHMTSRIREFFWPKAGWKRASKYTFHRLARLPGSAYGLAAGFACGAAISFAPFVGLHFIMAGLWAWLMRANILASAVGTAVGNPWTFPFIWVATYKLGFWMGADFDGTTAEDIDFSAMFAQFTEALLNADGGTLIDVIWPVWWPMMLGSIPMMVVVWIGFYYLIKAPVSRYQARRKCLNPLKLPVDPKQD